MSPLPAVTKLERAGSSESGKAEAAPCSSWGVTATIIIAGAYLMDRLASAASGLQAISLSGPNDGAPTKDRQSRPGPHRDDGGRHEGVAHQNKGHPVWLTFGASLVCGVEGRKRRHSGSPTRKFIGQSVDVLAV